MILNIKYRYALDSNHNIVDVLDLNESDRQNYKCVSCGNILRPVLGKRRQKHFRHKAIIVTCSEETYLHKLAKALFRQVYQECLDTGGAFTIEYPHSRKCVVCKEHGPCQVSPGSATYDLTTAFCEIKLETPDDGFIPDLLLSSESGEKLYVEIAVTHLSEKSKRDSGCRIIELAIQGEDDLDMIKNRMLDENDPRVNFINFHVKEKTGHFASECSKVIYAFVVWPSGKGIVKRQPPWQYEQTKSNALLHRKIVSHDGPVIYVSELENAYLAGIKVKNCFLCRYHARANRRQWREEANPIFCKFLLATYGSNHAADCEYYRPDKNVFEYHS